MFLFDKYRSSRQIYNTGHTCELRWRTFLPANPAFCAESTAITDNSGNFYFGSHSGIFYSIDSVGNIRWSFYTKAKIYSSPLLSEDSVIFASGDGWIYSLKCQTGEVVWKRDLRKRYFDNFKQKLFQTIIHFPYTFNLRRKMQMDTKCWSSPLLLNDKIYITAFGKGLYCLDLHGTEVWSVDLGFPRYQLSGVVADENDNIYFASRNGRFYSFTSVGDQNWCMNIGRYNVWGNPSYDDANKQILIPISKGESKGAVLCCGINGKRFWKTVLASAIYGSVAIDRERCFYYCADFAGYIYKLDAKNGKISKRIRISTAVRALWTTPTIDRDGNIYVTTKDPGVIQGRIIKMDSNLNEIWSYPLGQALSVPYILSNGDVCAGSWNGYYYCLKTK